MALWDPTMVLWGVGGTTRLYGALKWPCGSLKWSYGVNTALWDPKMALWDPKMTLWVGRGDT